MELHSLFFWGEEYIQIYPPIPKIFFINYDFKFIYLYEIISKNYNSIEYCKFRTNNYTCTSQINFS